MTSDHCPCGFNPVTMDGGDHYCPRCGWRPVDPDRLLLDGAALREAMAEESKAAT